MHLRVFFFEHVDDTRNTKEIIKAALVAALMINKCFFFLLITIKLEWICIPDSTRSVRPYYWWDQINDWKIGAITYKPIGYIIV